MNFRYLKAAFQLRSSGVEVEALNTQQAFETAKTILADIPGNQGYDRPLMNTVKSYCAEFGIKHVGFMPSEVGELNRGPIIALHDFIEKVATGIIDESFFKPAELETPEPNMPSSEVDPEPETKPDPEPSPEPEESAKQEEQATGDSKEDNNDTPPETEKVETAVEEKPAKKPSTAKKTSSARRKVAQAVAGKKSSASKSTKSTKSKS